MNMIETKQLVESIGMVYKGEFLEQLSKDDFNNGMRKINLQPLSDLDSLNGEGCWAWFSKEDREIYDKNDFSTMKVILANSPIEYMGVLFWGSELVVKCNGEYRATLDKDWILEYISRINNLSKTI